MYAKNVAFPSVAFPFLRRRNKRTLLRSIKFLHTLFFKNEEKTNETKIDKCFPTNL